MAVFFVDASGLLKRYVVETGTPWIVNLLGPATGAVIFVAAISGVEVTSAIARRGRSGSISRPALAAALAQFHKEFAGSFNVIDLSPSVIRHAMALAQANALRGYDAVQLAAACQVNATCLAEGLAPLTLVSADVELNAAAALEGMAVDDPNSHL